MVSIAHPPVPCQRREACPAKSGDNSERTPAVGAQPHREPVEVRGFPRASHGGTGPRAQKP